MNSRSPTLEPAAPDDTAPKPPGDLFRVVKRLSSPTNTGSGVYLCLPRDIPPLFVPETSIDYGFQEMVIKEHAAFKKLPHPRLHQQMWLLEYPRSQDSLFHSVNLNGVSKLKQKFVKRLPQLVVVKMAVRPDGIRRESEVIEFLHRGREYSTLHIGSNIASSQITSEPGSSWLCLRPLFGPTLTQFGEGSIASGGGGIPSWFVAHIFLCLVDAVDFLHKDGVAHNEMDASHIMLNLYPSYMHHRYRGYPDVQLIDFSHATSLADSDLEKDARGILWVIEQVTTKWSDVAPFLAVEAVGEASDDALIFLLRNLQVLSDAGVCGLEDIKRKFTIRMEKIRNAGPDTIPRDLIKLLHSDLAREEELESAMRDPLVAKFEAKKEELRKIVDGSPVVMGIGGHAGMKTQRIMVMRFTKRKAGFLRIVGEGYVEEEDIEMDDMERGDVEMTDAIKNEPIPTIIVSLFGGD